MKIRIQNLFVALFALAAFAVHGQTFTNVYSFSATSNSTNSDGSYPEAGLILSGNRLYGTAQRAGAYGNGAVFAVNTDGTGFTNLYSFPGGVGGANPMSTLALSGNTLYGTANGGGSNNIGMVFAINTDGTGFTNLYSFPGGSSGAYPQEGVVVSGNTLYGVAIDAGTSGDGIVYAVSTSGTDFTNLHNFTGTSDGANPWAQLIISGNTLYGMAQKGGADNDGTVYAINTDGTGFTNLYSFTGGSDGANPRSALLLSGGTLYGTTFSGDISGNGNVFSISTNGTGFNTIHSFTGTSDGAHGWSQLLLAGPTLYGTANGGGANGFGTVFAVNINGTGFVNLYNCANNSAAAGFPQAGVVLSGNTLYGTAVWAGLYGGGLVYGLELPQPVLTILGNGSQNVLFWPGSAVNFTLQATTNLASPNWVNVTNAVPVMAVTITNQSSNQFFRLQSN